MLLFWRLAKLTVLREYRRRGDLVSDEAVTTAVPVFFDSTDGQRPLRTVPS